MWMASLLALTAPLLTAQATPTPESYDLRWRPQAGEVATYRIEVNVAGAPEADARLVTWVRETVNSVAADGTFRLTRENQSGFITNDQQLATVDDVNRTVIHRKPTGEILELTRDRLNPDGAVFTAFIMPIVPATPVTVGQSWKWSLPAPAPPSDLPSAGATQFVRKGVWKGRPVAILTLNSVAPPTVTMTMTGSASIDLAGGRVVEFSVQIRPTDPKDKRITHMKGALDTPSTTPKR